MLSRSIRVPPLAILLVLCFLLGYQFSRSPLPAAFAPLAAPPPDSVSKPARANGPRIALVTFVTEQHSYMHASLKGKSHYARRQGYDFVIDYEEHAKRGTLWWKFEMIVRLIKLKQYDWIWFLDFDTLITNTSIKLTDIIEETLANHTSPGEIDYLLTHDCNGLNAGSFIVRAHERSIKFLVDAAAIEERYKEKQLSEQDSMTTVLKNDASTSRRTIQVPQWKLNAFPPEIACFDEAEKVWEPGMFVLHFAGAWAHIDGEDPTGQLMRKYQGEVVWGDWEDMYESVI